MENNILASNTAEEYSFFLAECGKRGISFTNVVSFLNVSFPNIDSDENFLSNQKTHKERAIYKVGLYRYHQEIKRLAENNVGLEFNNPDKFHEKICIKTIFDTCKKNVWVIGLNNKYIIFNDIGLIRVSTGPHKGIIFRL